MKIILIGLGGALGSVCRYSCYLLGRSYWTNLTILPYLTTLIINLVGCFLIACFLPKIINSNFTQSSWTAFLTIGVLGGFTTFSAFSAENLKLVLDGKI